jgi:hypothetical protein
LRELEKPKSGLIAIPSAYPAKIMGIDGTSRRPCEMLDASSSVSGEIERNRKIRRLPIVTRKELLAMARMCAIRGVEAKDEIVLTTPRDQ